MKIVLAPDSFKGTMRSPEVCEIVRTAILSEIPDAEIVSVPMADGGEGTVNAVAAATGAELHRVPVEDALGRKCEAVFAYLPDSRAAVLEMAEASGIERLTPNERNPEKASTFGTGTMLKAAYELGARKFVMGIGGSATVDGGLGMVLALGATVKDEDGNELPPCGASLARAAMIESSQLELWRNLDFQVACDVTNPLLGPNGAAKVFGPQKGADEAMVGRLENGLANWSALLQRQGIWNGEDAPGDGAAGGLGFALRVLLGAKMTSGAGLVADISDLRRKIAGADFVITGEGMTDDQTAFGKLPAVVADIARELSVPTVLLSGAVSADYELLRGKFLACFDCVPAVWPLERVLQMARENLARQARNLAALLKLNS